RSWLFPNFFDGLDACSADGREVSVCANVFRVFPAAFAFAAAGAVNRYVDAVASVVLDVDLGNDEQSGEIAGVLFEQRVKIRIRRKLNAGFERRADHLLLASAFEAFRDGFPKGDKAVPACDAATCVSADAVRQFRGLREVRGVDAARLIEVSPDFFHGEAEDGGEEANQRERETIERGLRAAAREGLRRGSVEPVFENVKVDRTEFDG